MIKFIVKRIEIVDGKSQESFSHIELESEALEEALASAGYGDPEINVTFLVAASLSSFRGSKAQAGLAE